MKRLMNDALISVGALLVLLVALVSIDDRVRDHLRLSFQGFDAAGAGAQASNLGAVALVAARDLTIAHAPMTVFIVAAVLLLVFMLRT
jgi:hypothetical protein